MYAWAGGVVLVVVVRVLVIIVPDSLLVAFSEDHV